GSFDCETLVRTDKENILATMPRRSRTSNFFSGTSSSHHGSNVNNLGSVQQDVDSMDHDHHASIGWTGHSNSSVSFRNEIAVEELNAENGQLPAPVANIGTGQTSREEWHSEPNEDKTLTDEVGTNSDAIPQKLDLNVALEDVNENISQEVGRNSMLVIVENYENINQEVGRNSTLVNVENYENNSQEVGRNSTLVNVENYERNTRRRITPANEQGFPPSSLSSPIYVDDDTDQRGFPPSSLSSPIYIDDDTDELPNWVAGPSSASVLSVSPTILDSSSSAVTEEGNSPDVSRSGSVQSALVSRTGWGNPGQNQLITSRNAPRNQGFPTGFAGFQRSSSPRFSPYNINGEFQNGFAAGARLSSNSPVFLRRNVAGEHAERLPIAVNRSRLRMASTGYERQITNHLQTSVRGRLGSRAFNPRDPRRALMIRDAGHNAAMPSFLPISHPLVASHFRATLVPKLYLLLYLC
ncbi:hypothetical protein U1Q18_039244, partial [Sarracenia purpurea var. burkii]